MPTRAPTNTYYTLERKRHRCKTHPSRFDDGDRVQFGGCRARMMGKRKSCAKVTQPTFCPLERIFSDPSLESLISQTCLEFIFPSISLTYIIYKYGQIMAPIQGTRVWAAIVCEIRQR